MALINIDTAIKRVLLMVAKIAPPRGVEILTYKRNRGVSIIRLAEDSFLVREHGYRSVLPTWPGCSSQLLSESFPAAGRCVSTSWKGRIFSTRSAKEFDELCCLC